ncbi:MAG TPA: aminotransferase class V-fold PLP-dependent enzyme [Flavobacteriales bacterium]|nr:aminotransferase class V-fold PLP-dependent enzyme [Flavobacteriales bacterium]|tara:strand:+ start:4844 stop:5974 length:1131 start_codon:yes stop_codon:yes gene_type:complete
MKTIQMVNLVSQYEKIQTEVDQKILEVVRSSQYINGPEVKLFAEELSSFLGVKHVIPCANGTDALQIAMMALGLKPGDEVITASFTYIATVEVIGLLGLVPVLVEVDPDTFNLDISAFEAAITENTKVVVPVHLYGQCANMEEILRIAKKHDLKVVEDAAQAVNANYTFSNGDVVKAGCMGDVGTTSFFPSKNLGCYGDGGAIFTNNDELAISIRQIANHGQTVRYHHDNIGVNSRLDSLQAAVLRIKLGHLNEYTAARQFAAAYYDEAFKNETALMIPKRDAKSSHVFHQYTLKSRGIDRDEMQRFLASKNVPSMIYYPIPVHKQKAYMDERYDTVDFSNTDTLCESVISLPMQTELSEDQLEYIVNTVKEFLNK